VLREKVARQVHGALPGQCWQTILRGELCHILENKRFQGSDGIAGLFVVVVLQLCQDALPLGQEQFLP
jgi:hypothetical protein